MEDVFTMDRSKITRSLLVLILICAICFSSCSKNDYVVCTDDISNFNIGKYEWFGAVFSESTNLPENAEVIDYYYYDHFGEARDEYLELKFQTEEEIIEYLEKTLTEIKANLSDKTTPQYGEWFYEEQNPYNSTYTDLLCLYNHSYKPSLGEKPNYCGYSVNIEGNEIEISAHLGIISYSIEEKTVIQTFFDEYYNNSSSGYFIPKYFQKFGVPVTENHERYFYFN